MDSLHPLLPPCIQAPGPFSELYLAEILPTLPSWRPGEELLKEHQALRQLFLSAGSPGALLPQVAARALEHLGHHPQPPSGPSQPFLLCDPEGKIKAVALATTYQQDLKNVAPLLHRAMLFHKLRFGILTNGESWQLHHLPPDELPSPPYEVLAREMILAPFFSEPLRYFSLFFRKEAFDGFLDDALIGSMAAQSASAQALAARLSPLAEAIRQDKAEPALIGRALFSLFAAAKHIEPYPPLVERARQGDRDAARELCQNPTAIKPRPLDPLWMARCLQVLSPKDPEDPSGLRDARFVDPLLLSKLCTSALLGNITLDYRASSRWLLECAPRDAIFFDLTETAPLQLPQIAIALAVREHQEKTSTQPLQNASERCFALTPSLWQAELCRLSFLLFGVSVAPEQLRSGFLGVDQKCALSLPPEASLSQRSLFGDAAQRAIQDADDIKDATWLRALADAWCAQEQGAFAGYETLLSLVQKPSKLLSSTELSKARLWARERGALHWWLDLPSLSQKRVVFLLDLRGCEALSKKLSSLCKEAWLCVKLPPGYTKRQNTASTRAALLETFRLRALLELKGQAELVLLCPKNIDDSPLVQFVTMKGDEAERSLTTIPQESFLSPAGVPWTSLRAPKVVSLAARIYARSQRLRDLIIQNQNDADLFVSEEGLSLQKIPGFSPYQTQSQEVDAAYLYAASLSSALRFCLKVEGVGLLDLPIPRLRRSLSSTQREEERASLRPLLLAGRYDTLLKRAATHLSYGHEDAVFILLSEMAQSLRGLDTILEPIFSMLLGLSTEEESLLRKYAPSPTLPPPPRPLPIHPPNQNLDTNQRAALLSALQEKGTLSAHQAQGVTGLDSRKLRQLLTDLELSGEITRTGRGHGTLYHYKER